MLVNIHGGGFIASSSNCHQHYLRKWASMIPGCLILCLDYRHAPQSPFPGALDDVWQGYCWVLSQCLPQLGVEPKTLLIAGDSAGGNLAMSLMMRAIQTGTRVPDGALLAYPALNMSMTSFTPSLLIALDDYALRFNLLLGCIHDYSLGGDAATDPYISPSMIKDEDLAQFPPVRLIVSGRDPLRDENYRLLQRLVYGLSDLHVR